MSQPVAERRITNHEVTMYALRAIIARNKLGLTVSNLVFELLRLSKTKGVLPYIGPDLTLKQLLLEYEQAGELEGGVLIWGNGREDKWIKPTEKFKFERDEFLERYVDESVCLVCGKTADGHMGLSGYIMSISDHRFQGIKKEEVQVRDKTPNVINADSCFGR